MSEPVLIIDELKLNRRVPNPWRDLFRGGLILSALAVWRWRAGPVTITWKIWAAAALLSFVTALLCWVAGRILERRRPPGLWAKLAPGQQFPGGYQYISPSFELRDVALGRPADSEMEPMR